MGRFSPTFAPDYSGSSTRFSTEGEFTLERRFCASPPPHLVAKVKKLSENLGTPASKIDRKPWIEPVKEFAPLAKTTLTLGYRQYVDRPFSDVQGPEFSHVKDPRIAGSYVVLDGRTYVLHQLPIVNQDQFSCEPTANEILEAICKHSTPAWVNLSSSDDARGKQCEDCWTDYLQQEEIVDSQNNKQCLAVRNLSYKGHSFTQLHLDHWQDQQDNPDQALLFELLERFHQLVVENPEGVPFIHCAGGINRSRFFLCLYVVYRKLLENPDAPINVPEILMTSLIYRPHVHSRVLTWLEKYIPLLAQRVKNLNREFTL